jgi:hypothetical protein
MEPQKNCSNFGRQALPMDWDYSELNPFSNADIRTWESMFGEEF